MIRTCGRTLLLALLLLVAGQAAFARRGNSGCCSHHGGVGSCDGDVGRLVCRDGSYSPSCGCAKQEHPSTQSPASASTCKRGSHKIRGKCMGIVLPKHAILDATGNDWKCEDGYTRDAWKCVAAK